MRPDPLIGVCIPAYHAQRWLAEALDSVLAQRYRTIDVLVVDDGSTDGTATVAEGYGSPVRVVRQRNEGIGAARNRCVELARGELLVFLDADDRWTPASLTSRLDVLQSRPEVELVFGHVRHFAHAVDEQPVALDRPRPAHLPGAMLVRRAALERVGPFLTGKLVAQELDWLLRARELGVREETVRDQVYWRRVHDQNNSLQHRSARGEYAHVIKASLDRRRLHARSEAQNDG